MSKPLNNRFNIWEERKIDGFVFSVNKILFIAYFFFGLNRQQS